MNYIILARNNDDKTAQRIASFVDRDYLNAVKADHMTDFLDNIGLTGRWLSWSADTKAEADKLAEECRTAPNDFTHVQVIHDDTGHPLTVERLIALVKSIPLG